MTVCDLPRALAQSEHLQLILLGGLPGSGKSYYLGLLRERGWKTFDDFQQTARNDSALVRDAQRFPELISDLGSSIRCVVADIRFVHAPYRREARQLLSTAVGAAKLQFQVFENKPEQCNENVHRSPTRNLQARLREIAHWTNHYSVPESGLVLPVWRPAS